jgi:hypothetical protein
MELSEPEAALRRQMLYAVSPHVRQTHRDRAAESLKPLYGKSVPEYKQKQRAGVVQW